MESLAMIEIEISGNFLLDDVPDYKKPGVAISLASGFGGERLIRILVGAKDFFKKAKEVALQMLNYKRITGVKIKKDGIEIGSMRSDDVEELQKFIINVLTQVQQPAAPVKAKSKAKKPAKRR
jgi:hypothetical protein